MRIVPLMQPALKNTNHRPDACQQKTITRCTRIWVIAHNHKQADDALHTVHMCISNHIHIHPQDSIIFSLFCLFPTFYLVVVVFLFFSFFFFAHGFRYYIRNCRCFHALHSFHYCIRFKQVACHTCKPTTTNAGHIINTSTFICVYACSGLFPYAYSC